MDFTVDEMWQPPSGTPEMGRFNPVGISYLYMSDTEKTVISELKESGRFTILKTYMTRKSTVLDISKLNGYIFELCNKQKVGNIAKPNEYPIPNYIVQCCSFLSKERNVEIEGIKYRSSIIENTGYNYVFFNKFRDSFNKEEIIPNGCFHAQS